MFYANFVLAKKGPLARVWLAAHWEKKLSKAHVFETDLQSSVETIISPQVKIALRTSGHLLLGVVRIYSRKAKYLLADCTEALIKIKMAFRPEVVDLPADNQKAAVSSITLPEFQEWDALMTDLGNFDMTATVNLNTCRVEEITMKEDLISNNFIMDDQFFGDTPFGEATEKEIQRDESRMDESVLSHASSTARIVQEKTTENDISNISINQTNMPQMDNLLEDGGFGAGEGLDFLDGFGLENEGLLNLEDLDKQGTLMPLDDTLTTTDADKQAEKTSEAVEEEADAEQLTKEAVTEDALDLPTMSAEEQITELNVETTIDGAVERTTEEEIVDQAPEIVDATGAVDQTVPPVEQQSTIQTGIDTMLISRDTEALALEPIEVSDGKDKRKKRKRKLIVDDEKIISGDRIRLNLNDTADIIKAASVAPPTKVRMMLNDSSTKSIFTLPTHLMSDKRHNDLFHSHLTPKVNDTDITIPSSQDIEEEEMHLEPAEVMRDAHEAEAQNEISDILHIPEQAVETTVEELQPMQMDLEMEIDEEEPPEKGELLIPPPFQVEQFEVPVLEDLPVDEIQEEELAQPEPEVKETSVVEEEEEEEEEGADKVEEDLQDKRWKSRSQQTMNALSRGLKKKQPMRFQDILNKSSRKQASYKFYTLLILNKDRAITITQETVFGDIFVDKAEKFHKIV